MFEKLVALNEKYKALEKKMAEPEVLADPQEMRKFAKDYSDLGPVVLAYRRYQQLETDLRVAEELLLEKPSEEEEILLNGEISLLEEEKEKLQAELKVMLIPRDPNDEKNVLVEIRAGTGGDEAALFAADLFRMYTRFAETQGWRVEIMSSNPTELGGFKEVIFLIEGKDAYSQLKFESGVHRVQRIPNTETGGRIHTSAATVVVLPEAEDVELELDLNDLRIDVYRSSGHGGQSVNTTDSAVRVTHLPSGMVVTCQDEKSQLKNKEKALKILRARLLDKIQQEQQQELMSTRRSMVKSGDRSERIRTYNFPQNRITDHRIDLTLYRLDSVMAGDLEELISKLILSEQAEKLKPTGEGGVL
ncbi:MAG TPA: peptide chain release factor 1 [Firmicutes bacterium]|jgi:peptide chain release factor 1|nr:peptide chain release factor 1 [Bacillota bacterium]HBT15644.1 peptide chain release factor 1 [Bacillota bacterium]